MTVELVAVHLLLAVVLFFLANWIGKYSVTSGYHILSLFEKADEAPAFNFVFRVTTPLVFLALTASSLYFLQLDAWVHNLYWVTVFYFLIRWVYALLIGRGRLLSWPRQIVTGLATVLLSYALYVNVLSQRHNLLPDPSNLTNELWVLIIVYIYTVVNGIPYTHAGATRRRKDYIVYRYHTLRASFATDIAPQCQSPEDEALVYAVLIYETFNRPAVYRAIEKWLLFPAGLAKSVGPMQMQSESALDDHSSVTLGATTLLAAYRAALPRCARDVATWDVSDEKTRARYARSAAIRAAARDYNIRGDYSDEIEAIFDLLVEEFYPAAKIE
jgi:hypothetical protein